MSGDSDYELRVWHQESGDVPNRHQRKETPEAGGGRHRVEGEPADPITAKRKPGANMAKPLVNEMAAEKYRNKTKGIR